MTAHTGAAHADAADYVEMLAGDLRAGGQHELPVAPPRTRLRTHALLWALAAGGLGDTLLRAPGRPGLNVALWAASGVCTLAWLLHLRDRGASRETRWLVAGALALAAAVTVRDAGMLWAFSMLGAILLLVLAAGRATDAWFTRAQPSDVAFRMLRVAALAAGGPIGWGRGAPDVTDGQGGLALGSRTLLRGVLLALPALLLLGALLMSADPVFERLVTDAFAFDLELALQHGAVIVLVGWFSAGYLRAFLLGDEPVMARLRVPQPALAPAEVSVALWILNLLFLSFMLVQLRYLFGGADLVAVTEGLTYAAYARRGFFELVAAAALVVPLLLAADWAAAPEPGRGRTVLRATMLVLVLLLAGVIGSAAYRMRLYQAAYGLTELRLLVSVAIVGLTAILAWLAATVLRGRRDRFAAGVLAIALSCLAALHVMNPHAVIARINIDRAAAGAEYDADYLRELSADAVPVLIAGMDRLPQAERCRVRKFVADRWLSERPGGWRTWNMGDARARRLATTLAAQSRTATC